MRARYSIAPGPASAAWSRPCVITTVIVAGLALDAVLDFWGQTFTNTAVWLLLLYWLRRAPAASQLALLACVLYATAGEILLSLVWGLYDYRLGNIPLFVPPGHALLFMLGGLVAARAGGWIIWAVPAAAAPFVLVLAVTGADTLGFGLYALFCACLVFGRARRLYAVMFVLALGMEVYGTWLGNWTWRGEVPWLGLATLNPPLAAGAFYCVLDLLVVATVGRLVDQAGTVSRRPAAWLRAAMPWARRARTVAGT